MHLQPYGQMVPEGSFDVAHVASQIVSIANLPNSVTVLEFNIMYVVFIFTVRHLVYIEEYRVVGVLVELDNELIAVHFAV